MQKRFFILLALFFNLSINAQVRNFRFYGLDEGLSQSQVSTICQDHNGYIWLGTLGGGLNRFDGIDFVSYSMIDGLSSNMILKVFSDSKNTIWIGTDRGICKYDGKRFEKVPTPFDLSDKAIWDITQDKKGNIWFATGGYGVLRYDGIKFYKYGINDGLGFSHAYRILCDQSGTVWVSSKGYGFARFKGELFENVADISTSVNLNIDDISETTAGELLFFTPQGTFQLIGNKFITAGLSQEVNGEVIASLVDKNGSLWVATNTNGIFRFSKDGASAEHFKSENGIPDVAPLCLFEDKQGNVWIGFDGGGCAVFMGDRFIHFNKQTGLPNQFVRSILQDNAGKIWFGTENGIAVYDENKFTILNEETGMPNAFVHSLYQDKKGRIWAGTEDGPILFDGTKINHYPYSSETEVGQVFCFLEDPESGELYIGTENGIMVFNGNEFENRYKKQLPGVLVFSMRLMGRNDIWVSTNKGLFRFNGTNFHQQVLKDEYGPLDAVDCWKDPKGNTWVITSRGIVILRKNGTKEILRTKNGLHADNLYLMVFDGRDLWIGSDKGLDRIIPDEDWAVKEIRHYGKEEGFTGMECNANSVLKDRKGRLWFGTIKGVTCYFPDKDKLHPTPPPLLLTGMRLLYEKTNWKEKYQDDQFSSEMPDNINLHPGDDHITFDFIAFDFYNPKNIRYRYMLEGVDQDWSPPDKENSATYSYIPPGEYRFAVKACNSDGFWSEPVYFSFSVDAPFWKKKWFYALLLPLVVILFYVFLLIRTRNLNKAKRQLEEKVRERTSELNAQKEQLQKLSIVASKMNEGVIICDQNGNIEWYNDSYFKTIGYTKEQYFESAYGKVKTLQELSSYKSLSTVFKNFPKTREAIVYDSPHQNQQGEVEWTRSSIVPVFNDADELNKIIAIYTNITDRKNVEIALEQANKDFLDSVKYAKRIQEAVLPHAVILENEFPNSFVFYKPRDIVSGDFYWFAKVNNVFLWALADCTGHGVPGAFMSLIGNEYLHQVTHNALFTGPEQCLHFLDKQITRALHQDGGDKDSRDGMDIGLCAIHTKDNLCQFSGANIPLYLIRNGEVIEMEAVKEAIGGYNERGKDFYSHEFPILPGDTMYMTSDGFIDQFGGTNGKKFMRRNFRELILRIHMLPMEEQKTIIETEFNNWKNDRKQVDDVLVIGIKIP
ncbi:MAG TPA: two-component regulator propeller domain-containing protein [Flavobacteriales bacterium]|nr:two-component regulator propeller domain-containing protein [Flavobacteriales bacterium]HRJ38051.1 two-component regulator propeller domain-containing protein [Flavobacteriales bacterium]